jgi:hypothetical protein
LKICLFKINLHANNDLKFHYFTKPLPWEIRICSELPPTPPPPPPPGGGPTNCYQKNNYQDTLKKIKMF